MVFLQSRGRENNRGVASEPGRVELTYRLLIPGSHQFFVGFELLDEITVHPILRVVHVLVNTPSSGLLHLEL